MNKNNVYFGQSEIVYLMLGQNRPLCSHQPFNSTFKHSMIYRKFFAYTWFKISYALHTTNARWLSLLCFAHFCTRVYGGAQLLACSHLVDHISISLVFYVNFIGQISFLGDKTWHFLVHPFLQLLYSKSP